MTAAKSRDLNDLAVAGELPDDLKSICKRVQVRPSKAPVEIGERPIIHVTTELSKNVDEAEAVLGQDPTIFQRDGQLVRVVRVARSEASATLCEGTPTIRILAASTARELLASHAQFLRYDARADDYVPCLPSRDIVDALISRGEYPHVRPITGIVESPMWLGDNQIMQEAGYDSSTGYLYAPTADFPMVPEAPSEVDCKQAGERLASVWNDFPWRSPHDRAVIVSLLLSLLCRPAVGDVPAFALDATTPGSGKGLAIDAACCIATGRRANKQTYAYDPIEQEKILGAMAMRGANHVAFDDIKDPFGGSPLCKVLTCGGATSSRILGRSEMADVPWVAVITVTGNNIQLMGDIPRRVVMARLEPTTERPELREDFEHPKLLDWVLAHRAKLVVAALTLVRGWWLAGRPSMGLPTLGSFESWAELVPRVCAWAGLGNPLECCPSNQIEEDPQTAALRTVIKSWPLVAPRGDTLRTIVERLYPEGKRPQKADEQSDLRDAMEVLSAPKHDGYAPDSRKLGNVFSTLRGRVIEGRKLDHVSGHGGIKIWKVVPLVKASKTTDTLEKTQHSLNLGGTGWTGGTNPTTPHETVKKVQNEMTVKLTSVENVQPVPPVQPAVILASDGFDSAEYASEERLLDGLAGLDPCHVCGCHPCQCEVLGL